MSKMDYLTLHYFVEEWETHNRKYDVFLNIIHYLGNILRNEGSSDLLEEIEGECLSSYKEYLHDFSNTTKKELHLAVHNLCDDYRIDRDIYDIDIEEMLIAQKNFFRIRDRAQVVYDLLKKEINKQALFDEVQLMKEMEYFFTEVDSRIRLKKVIVSDIQQNFGSENIPKNIDPKSWWWNVT